MFTSKRWIEDARGHGKVSEEDKTGVKDTICTSLSCTSGDRRLSVICLFHVEVSYDFARFVLFSMTNIKLLTIY